MAGWLMISLTKYSTGDTKPHKRTGLEGFSPILGQVFTGIALKQDSGFGQVSEWERGRPG
jgi:hypothetical protein